MRTFLLAAAAVLIGGSALAQPADKAGVNPAVSVVAKTQDFVTLAARGDILEIESSKLALTKSENDKIKQFAEKMIKDHTETSAELRNLLASGKVPATVPSTLDIAEQSKLGTLDKLTGTAFTKQYAEIQVAAHKDAVTMFENYSQNGDNTLLKAFAAKYLPHLKEHLKMAEMLDK